MGVKTVMAETQAARHRLFGGLTADQIKDLFVARKTEGKFEILGCTISDELDLLPDDSPDLSPRQRLIWLGYEAATASPYLLQNLW